MPLIHIPSIISTTADDPSRALLDTLSSNRPIYPSTYSNVLVSPFIPNLDFARAVLQGSLILCTPIRIRVGSAMSSKLHYDQWSSRFNSTRFGSPISLSIVASTWRAWISHQLTKFYFSRKLCRVNLEADDEYPVLILPVYLLQEVPLDVKKRSRGDLRFCRSNCESAILGRCGWTAALLPLRLPSIRWTRILIPILDCL